MSRCTHVMVLTWLICSGTFVLADEVNLESIPPVVVKTVPEAGQSDVNASTKEIRVTFSKEMETSTWTWAVHSKDSFPKLTGKPKFLNDQRTCVLPVTLEAGKTYAIWVNTSRSGNFKDKEGQSAIPYLLAFKTKK